MGNRAIHVVETAGDTTGLREFANGQTLELLYLKVAQLIESLVLQQEQ